MCIWEVCVLCASKMERGLLLAVLGRERVVVRASMSDGTAGLSEGGIVFFRWEGDLS